jgi:UDP-N-acetylmuramoyl-tripeptide--D-alanyl-D-alanine ligase
VLRADEQTRYLVLEMGMRGLGHIHYLCGIARPDVALILNVGSAHQEMLGGIDGIAQAKGELVDALSGAGLAVLNGDDPRVLAMRQRSAAPIMTFGGSVAGDVRATDIRLDEHARPSFTLHHHDEAIPVALRLTGAHMVSNALGAAAVALSLGMHIATVGQLLSTAAPSSPWRMEVTLMADGTVVINDAYNANPESVTAALQALVAMSTSGTRWAILGEMRELGPDADSRHAEIGRLASTLGVDRVIVVGERARAMADAVQSSAVKCDLVSDASAALEIVQADVRSGDIILVKASRAVGLESIASALLSGDQTASEGSRA